MQIPVVAYEETKRFVRDRHYYLKMAQQAIKLRQLDEMHKFCHLAELKQIKIDEFTKLYPSFVLDRN